MSKFQIFRKNTKLCIVWVFKKLDFFLIWTFFFNSHDFATEIKICSKTELSY